MNKRIIHVKPLGPAMTNSFTVGITSILDLFKGATNYVRMNHPDDLELIEQKLLNDRVFIRAEMDLLIGGVVQITFSQVPITQKKQDSFACDGDKAYMKLVFKV